MVDVAILVVAVAFGRVLTVVRSNLEDLGGACWMKLGRWGTVFEPDLVALKTWDGASPFFVLDLAGYGELVRLLQSRPIALVPMESESPSPRVKAHWAAPN